MEIRHLLLFSLIIPSILAHGPKPGIIPGTPPEARGPPLRRHKSINVDLEEEREHIKEHIKEEHIDMEKMDDNSLIMQYFKKHDTDNNMKLDGLEMAKALVDMEEDDHHHDHEENPEKAENNTETEVEEETSYTWNAEEMAQT